jgi:hypothetical protein
MIEHDVGTGFGTDKPAWYLGRHPERQFISASASVMLAEDFGRDVRNLIATSSAACRAF